MNLNKKLITLSIILSLFLIIPLSFASDMNENLTSNATDVNEMTPSYDVVYVNSTQGSSEGTGSMDNPVSTIEEGMKLVKDNGTIYLTGEFLGDGNSNITFDGTPNHITFTGLRNATIDGNYATSFATINTGNYTFNNLNFINNYKIGDDGVFGGVIYNINGELTFNNCLFENNLVYGVNRGNGGAIDNSGTVTITDCIFKNNIANVSNSSGFRKNAADGGALSNVGNLNVFNTVFIENKALRNGGAIRTQDGGKTYISDCNFTENVAAYHLSGGSYGGAVYTWDCALEVYNSIFKNNKVYDASGYGAHGGAISANRGGNLLKIQYCEFINNTADGITTIDGQSIYIDSVEVNVNYCTIDTGVYSSSQKVDLNYNWWVVNNTDIKKLIEMLPASASIKTYAEPIVIADMGEPGETIEVIVKLCWNGTENQNNINLIPERNVYLESNCGILSSNNGTLKNGIFKTTMTVTNTENPLITAIIDNVIVNFDFTKTVKNETKISATESEIFEGETANILIDAGENENGICLIDVDKYKYYVQLVNGQGNISIPNLKTGTYDVMIKYLGNDFNKEENVTTRITVNEAIKPVQLNTVITLKSKINCLATDIAAGESGTLIYCYLTDINGKPLAGKIVQMTVNGPVYNVITDSNGKASIKVNLTNANTYTCAVTFQGDENYNAAKLVTSKLTVTKKSTSIKASAKTFKSKTKTKKVSVTLKTVKNQYNSKTYLKKGKKITLKVNGKTYSAKTNAKGVAKFSIKLTKKGKYTAKIRFAGDKTYKASTKSIKIRIK